MSTIKNRLSQILNSWIGVLFFIIVLFFLTMPHELQLIPFLDQLSAPVLRVSFVLLAVCLAIFSVRNYNFKKRIGFLAAILLYGIVLFASLTFNGQARKFPLWWYIGLALVSVFLVDLFSQVNLRKYLFVFFVFFLIYNTVNNASAFFFFNTGMWSDASFTTRDLSTVFVGNVNSGIYPGMLSLYAGLLYARIYDRRWNAVNVANLLFSFAYAYIVTSTSQLVVYTGMLVLVICNCIPVWPGVLRKICGWFNAKTIVILDLLVYDAVVVLGNSGWMQRIGLNPEMHGRRDLWNTVLQHIFAHPILGVGFEPWIEVSTESGVMYFVNEHCFYLQIPHQTGLIGAAVFGVIVLLCMIQIGKTKQYDIRFLMGFTLGLLFLFMVNELMDFYYLFLFLASFYFLPIRFREDCNEIGGML